MNLFIYTGASRLNAAVVESATDLTPVSRLPDLIVGDSEPVTVKFLSASGTYESWSGGGTYTLSISIGALGADGVGAYFQTSSFTAVTNGWTGRLDLAASALRSAVGGYLADRPGVTGAPLTLQVRVTDASGNTETYARQSVVISGAVSVPTTADSTPVTYATAADVAADAATASAAAIAAAASASAAAGSASTAAGHVTTAGNSATAAAASATTAGNSATTASGHATTATTQATNAATSASSASTYKDAAAVSAASATSSAGTATTQAALATTNGAAQVTLATTQATNAGTSASAAAVSAAAALVSEAAALVSKNAAAASAATASAVSGSGNGTFSAAALTGVNSVTASASTPLTLTGGTTGASLVLGAVAAPDAIVTLRTAGLFGISGGAPTFRFNDTTNGNFAFIGNANDLVSGTAGFLAIRAENGLYLSAAGNAQQALLTSTGNLLIGTTTDMTGSGGLKIAGTTAATTTTSGALIVAGGVGVSGAGYFGGDVSIIGAAALDRTLTIQSLGAQYAQLKMNTNSSTANNFQILAESGGRVYFQQNNGAINTLQIESTGNATYSKKWNISDTTSASSSTVGALTIGNGTAATNVAIGGGNINAGGTITAGGNITTGADVNFPAGGYGLSYGVGSRQLEVVPGAIKIVSSSPSTGVGTGALQVAGGIYAGAASVFGSTATFAGAVSIGNAVSAVSPTSPNRTITIVVGGVTLYIAAKTTND
jgi:hypothetical protein